MYWRREASESIFDLSGARDMGGVGGSDHVVPQMWGITQFATKAKGITHFPMPARIIVYFVTGPCFGLILISCWLPTKRPKSLWAN